MFDENQHSNSNKMQFINYREKDKINISKPNSGLKYNVKGNSVHSIIVKHQTNLGNKISATPNLTSSTISTNPNTSNTTSRINLNTQSASKFKTNKELSAKKLKPISINFTSVESPYHKAIYIKENENEFNIDIKPLKSENNILMDANSNPLSRNSYNTYESDSTATTEIKKTYNSFYSSNTAVSFLIQQFGENKVDQLLYLIENSSNLIELLNGDGREIKRIVGDKYQTAQNLLKRVVAAKNSPQKKR
jgi:hypothetical protein